MAAPGANEVPWRFKLQAAITGCVDELRIEGNRVYARYRLPMTGVRIAMNSVSFRLVDPRGFEALTF